MGRATDHQVRGRLPSTIGFRGTTGGALVYRLERGALTLLLIKKGDFRWGAGVSGAKDPARGVSCSREPARVPGVGVADGRWEGPGTGVPARVCDEDWAARSDCSSGTSGAERGVSQGVLVG